MSRNFKHKISLPLLAFALRVLSYVIPKKKGFLVFDPRHNKQHFSGNIKALLLYAQKHYKQGDLALIANERTLYEEAKGYKSPVVQNKLGSFWLKLRAEHIMIDAAMRFYIKGNFSYIQLWHGTGFKNIAFLNPQKNVDHKSTYKKLKSQFHRYQFLLSTSKVDRKKKKESFGIENVFITGLPRNDVFFQGSEYFQSLKKKYHAEGYKKIITYVPTYRDVKTATAFTDFFWERLNEFLERENSLFVIKKHPLDDYLDVPQNFKRIQDWTQSAEDIQEVLAISDLLISDYSSIIADFALTNRPILLYMYDQDLYEKNCRSSYYPLDKVLPRPFVYNEKDLLAKIRDQTWTQYSEYRASYTNFKNKFHFYEDGNSSKRVLNLIEAL